MDRIDFVNHIFKDGLAVFQKIFVCFQSFRIRLVLVKQIRKYAEGGKVAIRNIRRDAMETFKKKQKASELTEDDLKIAEKDLQKLTDDMCKELDALLEKKEKELMEV